MDKKLLVLTVFISLFLTTSLIAAVDTRLVLVSNIHGATQGTLIIDVEAKSTTSAVNIRVFQDKFYLDAALRAQIADVGDVTFSLRHFSTGYNITEDYDPSSTPAGKVRYVYTYDSGSFISIGTDWTRIIRVSIVYTLISATSTISWGNHDTEIPFWLVTDDSNTPIRGSHDAIPSGLTDFSLPVQMSNIAASSSQTEGVTIVWTTQSEVNTAGFHVWRSEEEAGEYQQVSTSLIPGQGNSSTAQTYTFNDRNVDDGILYWYKVQELAMTGESTFFGPVSVVGVDPIPRTYDLSQNYPNPFNPETQFHYQLPEESDVSVVIYSLLGQRVRDVVKEKQPAGYYEERWDGKDNLGRDLPSGIYLLQITTGSFKAIRKMALMR